MTTRLGNWTLLPAVTGFLLASFLVFLYTHTAAGGDAL